MQSRVGACSAREAMRDSGSPELGLLGASLTAFLEPSKASTLASKPSLPSSGFS